ncbi:MAG TPA: bacillithiol system redox-active protein YtxJ [Flavobacterium sp.]|nr:bacillithiol system redox-active protein YtxJ [Flavobacterium sp.]
MNLFSKIFGDSTNKDSHETAIHWNTLTEIKQLDTLVLESFEQPVLIFKHSTRCNISRMALKQFEHHYSLDENEAKGYFLDLIAHRDVSNEIADRFSVIHQSPQLILLKDGKCIYTASHSDIDADELKIKVDEHQ